MCKRSVSNLYAYFDCKSIPNTMSIGLIFVYVTNRGVCKLEVCIACYINTMFQYGRDAEAFLYVVEPKSDIIV